MASYFIRSFIVIGLLCLNVLGAANVKIEPSSIKVVLDAQDSKTQKVVLTNLRADKTLEYWVEPEFWHPRDPKWAIGKVIKVTPAHFRIPPKGKVELILKLNVPDKLSGENMIMVYLAPKPNKGSLAIQTRIGFPVYVQKKGTAMQEAVISVFKQIPNTKSVEFEIAVYNKGNCHILPFGVVLIKEKSKIIAQKEVRFLQPIFPGKTLKTFVSIPGIVLKNKHYQAQLKLFLEDLYQEGLVEKPMKEVSKLCGLKVAKP